ncbi:MAG: glycosyltransferase [Propionibacteriaceae bacterium]
MAIGTDRADGSSLRIAQLANFVGPTTGGMRRAIDKLGEGYCAAGAERLLIIPGAADRVTHSAELGTVVEIKSPHVSKHYRMITQPRKVVAALEDFQPTSIESTDKWTLAWVGRWGRKHAIPTVLFSHERLDGMMGSFLRAKVGIAEVTGAMNRRLSKEFDAVIVTSQYAADEFVNTGAKLVLCPLGVDLETFTPSIAQQASLEQLHTVYVGRLSREKFPQLGIKTALELQRRGIDIVHHVYGAGQHEPMLREVAGNGPIVFHGYVDSRQGVADALASAHLCLSVCPVETFGLQVLESLACGTPVITANRGGARELVDESCGEWDDPNPLALADAVERLYARLRDDQAKVRQAARARAEQYPWSAPVKIMVETHRHLAEGTL